MEFTSPSGPSHNNIHTPGLNMELVHDFGEGVGVDMRDFNTGEKDDIDPELATPQLQTSGMSSIPPTSIMTANNDDMFQAETGMDDEDDDDDGAPKKRKTTGQPGGFTFTGDDENSRRKIRIEYITDKSRRHITFSKRKAGIMKKAYELSILTGTQILLLVVSETGLVYTFTTTKLQPIVQKAEGKNLIQACLNAPDGYGPDGQPLAAAHTAKNKNGGLAIRPHKLTAAASAALAAHAGDESEPSQADGQSTLGLGTPNRPKKRLASGKQKKGSVTSPGDDLPPVPTIPDMHRASSPSPHLGMALASPISGGYTYPASHHEYAHHPHAPHPGQPGFYPPEYAYGYPHPHAHGHGHSQYAPHMGVNPAGLQSPYHAPPHHQPQSSPSHRL